MILLSFLFNREVMNFKIVNRDLYYCDRIFRSWLRCIPRDDDFIRKVKLSRNRIPSQLMTMFNLSKKDKLDYDACKTEEEIAEKVIYDCKSKGLRLMKNEKVNDVVIQDKDKIKDGRS